jgi:hypothetical protein
MVLAQVIDPDGRDVPDLVLQQVVLADPEVSWLPPSEAPAETQKLLARE